PRNSQAIGRVSREAPQSESTDSQTDGLALLTHLLQHLLLAGLDRVAFFAGLGNKRESAIPAAGDSQRDHTSPSTRSSSCNSHNPRQARPNLQAKSQRRPTRNPDLG